MQPLRGKFFNKKDIKNKNVFSYQDIIDQLPKPILDDEILIDMFDYAIERVFRNVKVIDKDSTMLSNYQDSAFNQNLFLWDSVFISRFTNYVDRFLPGIDTLNNFYHKQLKDGLIPREIHKITGEDYPKWINESNLPLHSYYHLNYGFRQIERQQKHQLKFYDLGRTPSIHPYYTLDNLNHPLLAYAEYNYYLFTGKKDRLLLFHEALYQYYRGLNKHIKHQNGLYVTDWASMDNSPRNNGLLIGIDISSEMALFAKNMLEIYDVLGNPIFDQRKMYFSKEYNRIKCSIQSLLWDSETKFFYDLDESLKPIKIKTIAGFWPMIAGIITEEQKFSLLDWLNNPKAFNRIHRVPSLSADEFDYKPNGGYWSGGVWASTNLMITDGLEVCKEIKLAKEIALNHLKILREVFKETHTLWESYPADEISKGDSDKDAFVGWTGIAPIHYLLKYYVGLSVDAANELITWNIESSDNVIGCRSFSFLGKQADFIAEKTKNGYLVEIKTEAPFRLRLIHESFYHFYNIKGNTLISIILP